MLNRTTKQAQSSNVCFTLPITCQICLGKVKEPCVCPNLHAFCSCCIEIWLEKSKQCPTCRVAISQENPCRRILGGVENFDEADKLKPSEFSHSSMRKARFTNLFQQYEDEIARLLNFIDSLSAECAKYKETCNSLNNLSSITNGIASASQSDAVQVLKTKLDETQADLIMASADNEKLKEVNKKLESENSIMMQDISRLKASLNEKNSQVTSKYAMAALEAKVESYEKEIKQLQKALEKSDKYIAELEMKENHKANRGKELLSSVSMVSTTSSSVENHATSKPTFKFIKGDNQTFKNDLKIVKFSEKIDTIPRQVGSSSPPKLYISHDKFYGSPSKAPPNVTPNKIQVNPMSAPSTITTTTTTISSFAERMKKNAFDLSEPCEQKVEQPVPHNFLFSPMKRLRLDELPAEVEPAKILDLDTRKIIKAPCFTNPFHFHRSSDEFEKRPEALSCSTTEFNDCLQLLEKAEQKVKCQMGQSGGADVILTRSASFSSSQAAFLLGDNKNEMNVGSSVAATVSSSLSSCSSLFGSSNASSHQTNMPSSSSSSMILNNLSNLNTNKESTLNKSPERSSIRKFPSFELGDNSNTAQKSPPKELKLNDEGRKSALLRSRSVESNNPTARV